MFTTSIDEQLIADLFDTQPDSVVWFSPVFDDARALIDFSPRYCNEAAAQLLNAPKHKVVGQLLRSTDLMDAPSRQLVFEQCAGVWDSGKAIEYTYHNPGFDRYLTVQRSKVMGGILSITRDRTEQVRLELETQRQSQLLQSIINNSVNGICLYQSQRNSDGDIIDFRIVFANDKCADMTGFSLEELQRYSMRELVALRGHGDHFFIQCKNVVETGTPVRFEVHAKERMRWIAIAINKFDDGYLINYSDITESKLKAEKLQQIFDASINGMMAFEAIRDEQNKVVDLRFTQVNRAFTKILGYKADEVLGKSYLSVFPRSKQTGTFDLHLKVLETGESADIEIYYNAFGFNDWFHIQVSRIDENSLIQTFSNITELMQNREQLEQAAIFLQEVVNGSHTGILVASPEYDSKGKIVDYRFKVANQTIASLVGQTPEALIGTLHSQWFPEYYENGSFRAYNKIYQKNKPLQFESHYQNQFHDRWMDVSGKKIGDDLLITYHEVTALKKLQIQLEKTIGELTTTNSRLSEFTHIASHDLKEPLRKIIMYSNMLEERYGDKMELNQVSTLQKIQQTSYRMQTLINDLLMYSQVSARAIETEQVDLYALMQQIAGDLEATISEKQAEVEISDLPVVMGDRTQLQQMFQNLLSNALKFHKKEDVPRVTVSSTIVNAPKNRSVSARRYWCIVVKDEGIGFDPSASKKIYQLFQRLHSRSDYEGTGIGLAIVSKVVENHEGYIETESMLNEGSVFRVYLPQKDQASGV